MGDLSQRFEFDYAGPGGRGWGGWIGGTRGRFGASLTPVRDQLAAYFGVERGALVSSVETDSPAARAGLKAGDVITSMNGRTVADVSDVLDEVRRAAGGASVADRRDARQEGAEADGDDAGSHTAGGSFGGTIDLSA